MSFRRGTSRNLVRKTLPLTKSDAKCRRFLLAHHAIPPLLVEMTNLRTGVIQKKYVISTRNGEQSCTKDIPACQVGCKVQKISPRPSRNPPAARRNDKLAYGRHPKKVCHFDEERGEILYERHSRLQSRMQSAEDFSSPITQSSRCSSK